MSENVRFEIQSVKTKLHIFKEFIGRLKLQPKYTKSSHLICYLIFYKY